MKRREFIGSLAGATGVLTSGASLANPGYLNIPYQGMLNADSDPRTYQLNLLVKMALPVLEAMAKGRFQKVFPIELSPTWYGGDPRLAYLECFGRLLAGIAPWLGLPVEGSDEGRLRAYVRELAQQSLTNAVDSACPDYLAWKGGNQALVDSSYLTNALLRAPHVLWAPLSTETKQSLIKEIKGVRRFEPPYNNWLLFSAMNEVWLSSVGEDADIVRISTAVRTVNNWYVGDGWIKDGEIFHFDYYNSYVMWPMLLEVLEQMVKLNIAIYRIKADQLFAQTLKRTQRYCELLERLISPDGTYPTIGRSLTYRTAVFQPLALLALRKQLPASLPEGQVRAALHAAHQPIWSAPTNFTKDNFLRLGFAGHNPNIADTYSTNGSMYIAATGLLALGLPPSDSYWSTQSLNWTQKNAYANQPFPKDYAVDY